MPIAGELFYFDSNKNQDKYLPTVVLIHGAGGFHLHWPKSLRRMMGFRVLALDLPGHGKSGGLGEQTIEGYAKIIRRWLDQIGVGRAIFVGHSMGGAIVQSIALSNPGYVNGSVLIGTGATLPINKDLLERLSLGGNIDPVLDRIVRWSYSKIADPKLIKQARKKMDEIRPAVLYGDFLSCKDFDVSERISEIKTPTLIIVGEEDKMTPAKFSNYLYKQIKNSKLKVIPNAGHMVMIEKEYEVAKVLREFLEDLG